ncbi:uncharacterized protein LOC119661425 [Hermetia illucens]|uniref:uncharacterized protein LOC119661425 n=1 Tax=Hermetia illucens TaxID=343691 RepID=UPI0018CC2190|nr:uncharacterized protein LOC119661425 [Hermetia illucens]
MVQERCCCLPLEVCGLTIGLLDAIKNLAFLGLYIYFLVNVDQYTKEPSKSGKGYFINEDTKRMFIAVFCIYIVVYVGLFLAAIFLIAGIMQNRHKFILPWIIVNFINLTLTIINVVYLVASRQEKVEELKKPGPVIALSLILFFGTFAIVVIIKLYRLIRFRNAV